MTNKKNELRPMTSKEIKKEESFISIKGALKPESKTRKRITGVAYTEKLKHPKWQRKRLEILNRDDFKCTLCNDENTELHVHHEKYEKGEPWDIDNKHLTTLCKHCHLIIEYFKIEIPDLFIHNMYKISMFDYLCIFILKDSMGVTFGCINNSNVNIYFSASDDNFESLIEFYNKPF